MDYHVPFFGFHPYQELITAHPGIADQNVYASKRLDDIVKSCRRGRVVGNVKLADLAGAPHLLQGRYDLFSGLTPHTQGQTAIPVEGTVTSPANTVSLNASNESATNNSGGVILSEGKTPRISSEASRTYTESEYYTTPPQQGIAPDLSARSGLDTPVPSFEDRGIYHAADAMKDIVDMRDSPSCATCGAIMTRSGSCYRCMSCGSTSGCS